MFSFIFKSMKILVIWIIIGVLGCYGYGLLKPYLKRVEPAVSNFKQKAGKVITQTKNISPINNLIKKASQETEEITKQFTEKKEPHMQTDSDHLLKKRVADSDIKENEIFQRQMSIINDLMK